MDRRELLKMVALATGGVMIGGEFLLSGCKNEKSGAVAFKPDDIAFLDEVGETIIPTTSSPGAKAAGIGNFMKVMVTDCYTEPDQKVFMEGISQLNEFCKKENGIGFMQATPQQRTALLEKIDAEAKAYQKEKNEKEAKLKEEAAKERNKTIALSPNHYFTMMKQLTLFGYFTSKPGATQALRYVAVPGHYDGCMPYKKGDKAWAT
ncbi:MAG: gluconate 2-dehydrogenase subunit 3 family protein [Hydrotalea flava]|nr:gluconate 2-dehydrogenase subunit 3 family protein [Hydrotalea flava]NIM38470.1 gluconate 2-dehydrogenase subunit 3 family protein [Hydrotalea flava]NIN03993.1 gluconate 2-dehydrogenase subunit 3 family protein [Hydrotalea flava]NIN15327.1 gluconate 2-dehydrogenase subunit 3 family protein [Hydrotalea flava]NIO94396.1 gluconate 2-dehydrogenase subunit 3 family protein [Hydrotalea flava]